MPKIVCYQCHVEYKIEKAGAVVVDMFRQPPQPYCIWSCDAWKCPGCGHTVIAGFGGQPMAEHFQARFPAALDEAKKSGKWLVYNYERVSDAQLDPA